MRRSNSNPTTSTLTKRRSFRGWLKRVTLPNGANQRKVGPDMPKGGVFGIPLVMSIKYAKTTVGYVDDDGVKHTKAGAIPIVVAKCGSYLKKNGLETEGIFRISGSVKRVNALEFQFDQSATSYGLDLNWEGYTVHDATGVLRRYLNKLPDPVIPFEFYQPFRDVMNNNAYRDTEQRIEAFQRLIQSLPPPHQHLLLYLLDTLSLFASTASETKMGIPNLAAVFCPGILRHPDHNNPIQYKISQYVIEFLIEFQSLFTLQLLVPSKSINKSTFSSGGEVPPVPLLLASSSAKYQQQAAASGPPPVPLHVVNPSAPSVQSSSLSSLENNGSSFIESPTDIDQQQTTTGDKDMASTATVIAKSVSATAASTKESVMQTIHKLTKISSPYYRMMCEKLTEFRHTIEPWIAKPAALLICVSVLIVTLVVIVYEAYLAVALVSFEPLLFFSGLVSYWGLLYQSIPAGNNKSSTPTTTAAITPAPTDTVGQNDKEESEKTPISTTTPGEGQQQEENDQDEEALFPAMDPAEEKAMMQDETIMSEWRDLLTRAWKVTGEDGVTTPTATTSSAASIFDADNDMLSIMSRSSRFNEEENFAPPPATGSISSSSDEDDEELGFDADTLEMYLSQYDQIKKDAELAKQLQIEEQKARDSNNPFVVEDLAIGKRGEKPNAIDTSDVKRKVDQDKEEDDDKITTPTTADKEEWKIRVFPRQ